VKRYEAYSTNKNSMVNLISSSVVRDVARPDTETVKGQDENFIKPDSY